MIREIGNTIDRVLNTEGEPKAYGYVLVVAPIGSSPVLTELVFNITEDSARVVLVETLARIEGRTIAYGTKG